MDDLLKNNPLLNGMAPEKIDFLLNFSQKEKPTNMKDAMPFLLANMNIAKKNNINFSKPVDKHFFGCYNENNQYKNW